jgi:hypothetical protein
MRYAIVVTDARSGGRYELCRVSSHPEAVAEGARRKTYSLKHARRWKRLPMYRAVEIVEVADEYLNFASASSPTTVLKAARKAGVSVTVNCGCPGIFIDGCQYLEGQFYAGEPTHVPAEILAALIELADELEPLLRASRWWSCACHEREGEPVS